MTPLICVLGFAAYTLLWAALAHGGQYATSPHLGIVGSGKLAAGTPAPAAGPTSL